MIGSVVCGPLGKKCEMMTGPLSLHATTHIDILKRFLDIEVIVNELEDGVFHVEVKPDATE